MGNIFESLVGMILMMAIIVFAVGSYQGVGSEEIPTVPINNMISITEHEEEGLFTIPFVTPIMNMISFIVGLIMTPIAYFMAFCEAISTFPTAIMGIFALVFMLAIYRTIWGNK